MKHLTIPIFIPHLGCPHDCVFCNQRRISNTKLNQKVDGFGQQVLDQADHYTRGLDLTSVSVELAYFGGTFTALDHNFQKELLEVALKLRQKGIISHLRCSTRPDAVTEEKLAFVKSYGMDTIELGLQSMDDEVLLASGRGHSRQASILASRLIKNAGLRLGHQLMPGLPKSSPGSDLDSVRQSLSLNPDCVRIYPTLVIKDTPLAELYQKGEFQPLSLFEAIDQTSQYLSLYEEQGVEILRLGLMANEELNLGKGLIAGPWHPAFGELVRGYRLNKTIQTILAKEARNKLRNSSILGKNSSTPKLLPELTIHPRDLSCLYCDKKRFFKKGPRPFQVNVTPSEEVHFPKLTTKEATHRLCI